MTQLAKKVKTARLSWGGQVYVTPLTSSELVSIAGSTGGGIRAASSEELASLHADMLLEGTKSHTKKEIQEMLDIMGASLSFNTGDERLHFSAQVRSVHLPKLLKLIGEILKEPLFAAHELAALKKREEGALSLEAQDTKTQADIALSRMFYKEGHPNRQETTAESRDALERTGTKDLQNFHTRTVSGNTLIVSLAGDCDLATATKLIDAHFKNLPCLTLKYPPYVRAGEVEPQKEAVVIAGKENIDYIIGSPLGIDRNHPDYIPLILGMHILGTPSGFTGRLFRTVREEEGLTYHTHSSLEGFENDADGYFYAVGSFASTLFPQGRISMRREITKIVEEGVTPAEVRLGRSQYAAYYFVRLSNSAALANAVHAVIVGKHALSYLDEFPKQIERLTAREVNQALKKYIKLDHLCEAAAGPVEKNSFTS